LSASCFKAQKGWRNPVNFLQPAAKLAAFSLGECCNFVNMGLFPHIEIGPNGSFIPNIGQNSQAMFPIDHIGIAVASLEKSVPLFEKLLQSSCYKIEEVETEKVKTAFFSTGNTKVELLESTDPDGVIAGFIAKKGEGMHHIAFEVPDIRQEMERLAKEGFQILNPEPKMGADNKLVCFLHPKSTNGVLVELCQSV
jgi:methylmalonyl-CoA/ethylmalonyl-CoA epimerase